MMSKVSHIANAFNFSLQKIYIEPKHDDRRFSVIRSRQQLFGVIMMRSNPSNSRSNAESMSYPHRDSLSNLPRDNLGNSHRESLGTSHRESLGNSHRESLGTSHRESLGNSHRESLGNSHRESLGNNPRGNLINVPHESAIYALRDTRGRRESQSMSQTHLSKAASWARLTLGPKTENISASALFCKYTSAHGFRCAISPERHKVMRLIWKLAIAAALSMLSWGLFELRFKYFEYPVKTMIEVNYVRELPFPAVTLCNLHAFDYSKASLLTNVTNAANKLYTIHAAQNIVAGEDLEKVLDNPDFDDILEKPFSHIHKRVGMNISDKFKYCSWNGVKVNCDQIFKPVYTLDGRCYQFNYDPSHTYSTSLVGPLTGLSLLAELQDFDFNIRMPSGLKVHLHNPGTFPQIVTKGFLVPLGFSTYASIKVSQAIHLPRPYYSYGKNYCQSKESWGPGQDNNSIYYDRDSCIIACVYKKTMMSCNCSIKAGSISYTEPIIKELAECTFREALSCIRPTFAQNLLEATANNNSCATCHYSCEVTSFLAKFSYASYPTQSEGKRANYLELRLFYDQMISEDVRYEAEYTWHSILGVVGGHMGLFIGASVLTAFEAIECICMGLYQMFKKLSGSSEDVSESSSERSSSVVESRMSVPRHSTAIM